MHASRVKAELIDTKRLDPDYYHPDHLRDELCLRTFGSEYLGKTGRLFAGPFGSELPSSLYLEHGIPLFRVGNVGTMEVNYSGMAHLDPSVHSKLSASEVLPGDLLVVKASVGEKICKIPSTMPKANITQHIIALRPNGSVDTDYLSAFLYGEFGRRQLIRRSLGSIIQYLGINDARTILLPKVSPPVQTYIGDKVRQAERLRERARDEEQQIAFIFAFLTAQLQPLRKSWRTNATRIDSYRLNPGHYNPVVLDMLDRAASLVNLVELGSLFGKRDIAGGATPKGASYTNSGIFFVRVQNVKPLQLDLNDAVFIDSIQNEEIARSKCLPDDIIFTITGYPGTAALVLPEDLPLNINQHSVRFDVNSEVCPEYVVAALNSHFVKKQVDRFAIGGTRDALDYSSVRNILIPILSDKVIKTITEKVRLINSASRTSSRLTTAAKFLVEALIEGKLTEAELKAAQEALEQNNRSLDRSILSRLTRKGIDVADSPPLFPDLDALYDALEQVSSVSEEEKAG